MSKWNPHRAHRSKRRVKRVALIADYEKRRCVHPGCGTFPHFGFGPPLTSTTVWSCREHRGTAAQLVNENRSKRV